MTEALPVLPRQLTSLLDEVAAVGPPPIPLLADPYAIRVADPERDAETVSEWMNRPHLALAWEYDRPVHWWRGYLRAQLAGDYSRPLIGSLRGREHGYVEVYRAAKDSIGTRYDADPWDLGLHAAIADENIVNRGFGPLLLPRLAGSLFALERRCRRIMFDPDHRNSAARRLCEFAGCEFLGEHDMANRRMALYALHRPISSS